MLPLTQISHNFKHAQLDDQEHIYGFHSFIEELLSLGICILDICVAASHFAETLPEPFLMILKDV
jgi:hypothetical protein